MPELLDESIPLARPNGHDTLTTSTVQLGDEHDVHFHWPFIRKGLAAIKRRQGWRSTWTPEHVRASLLAKQAELWLGYQVEATSAGVTPPQGSPIAFSITQPMTDPFLHQQYGWFVWFAYRDPAVPSDIVRVMDAHLESVARFRGYRYLEALTARPGLGKRMKPLGWDVVMEVIRKDLWLEDDEVR